MLNDLYFPAQELLDPLNKTSFFVGTIGPDQLESGKEASQRFQQEFAALVILDICFVDQHVQDQAHRINKDMSFTPLDFLAAVIAASPPPFWLVLTD
jgi:hypothetical protein